MDLNQLEIFRRIAHRQNISQAARDLYLSQSALTKTLHQIEDELGTLLFVREGRKIYLNKAGEILLHYADLAGNSLDNAEELIEECRTARTNVVRVIFRTPLGNPVKALKTFMEENPSVIPHVAFESEVRSDYDLEVFSSRERLQELDLIEVCEDRYCLLLSKQHYLSESTKIADLNELRSERFVGFQPWGRSTAFDLACLDRGFSPIYAMAHSQVEGVLSYLSRNYLAVGPCVMWLNERRSDLKAIPFAEIQDRRYIYIRVNEEASAQSARSLARHLRDHLVAAHLFHEHCFI